MNSRRSVLLVLIWAAGSAGALAAPPGPEITLTPTSMTIQGPQGGPNPAPSTLTVKNSGGGKLKWKAVSNAAWLDVNPKSGDLRASESTDLSVTVDLTVSGPATRTGTITISDGAASNSPQTCTVTLQTSSSAQIGISPGSMTMTAPEGGPNPPGQTVTIQNVGGGTLNWTASFSPSWLSGTANAGTLAGGGSQSFTLSADVTTLSPGPHSATMTVTSPEASNSPQTLTVTVNVSQAPVIGLSAASLSFDGPQGGANPATQDVQLRNEGGGTLTWSAASNAGWLFVSPASGSLSSGGSRTLTISVNTSGLLEGTYPGQIDVTAGGATNTPQSISVVLNVNTVPKIGINPKTLSFLVATDSTSSSASAVSITNTGSGTLTWTGSGGAVWLSRVPAGGSLPALVSEPLFLSVNAAGLSPGHYTTTVQIADGSAANSPQTLAVDLTVTESSLPVHAPAGQCGLLGPELLLPGLVFMIRRRRRGGSR